MNSMYEKVKRVMDVCLSFVCLVAFTPGFIVIAAIICMETPGSPISVSYTHLTLPTIRLV